MEAPVSRARSPGRDLDAIIKNVRAPSIFAHFIQLHMRVLLKIAQAIYFLLY